MYDINDFSLQWFLKVFYWLQGRTFLNLEYQFYLQKMRCSISYFNFFPFLALQKSQQTNRLFEGLGTTQLWKTTACCNEMSDAESDVLDGEDVLVHRSPPWRDATLSNLIRNLQLKRGNTKKRRALGQPSTRSSPGHKGGSNS